MFCYDEFSVAIHDTLAFGLFSIEVPVLVYYSHLTAIIVTLLLSLFIILNNRSLSARLLAAISLLFTGLGVIDIFLWTQIDSRILMFLWSFWLFIFIAIYLLSFYFLYTFIKKRDLHFGLKLFGSFMLVGVLVLSVSRLNLEMFDLYNCSAVEGFWTLNAVFGLSFLIFILVSVFGIRAARKLTSVAERRQAYLATTGVALFLFSFSAAAYTASVANLFGSEPDTFVLEQYGYFGMTAFIAFLTYIIVRYQAFSIKLIAAQALVVSLVVLIGSQFFFIRNPINYALNGITFALVIGFGYLLVRSVEREIQQRIQVQKLAGELERANKQQIILIHFITHQIKGFVTKSRNIFSMMKDGDFGPVPDSMKPMVEEGFSSDTKGVNTIQEILNAANIKSGKVEYKKEPFDLKALIDEIARDLKGNADAKGLALAVDTGAEPLMYPGDRVQLVNAFKNLIDNSIKYTPTGEVRVKLAQDGKTVRFTVEDTGVGITKDDMARLFTEGGHGANSAKVNVESTGFGLYIVKNIIEAHGGKVWAESEGEGKGSRFVVELPF